MSIAEMVFKAPHVRDAVFRRDGFVCWLCGGSTVDGAEPNSPVAPEIDHVIPRSQGGSDDVANLRCAHRFCNESRGDRHPDLSAEAFAERRRRFEDAVGIRPPGQPPGD